MSERQAQFVPLQMRAYASVQFLQIVQQDIELGIRFEPRMAIVNNGNTPAYKVRARSNADVMPFPLPRDIMFPLPDFAPDTSVGTLGPRQNFIIGAVIPRIYTEDEA